MIIKSLTIWNPWAQLIADKRKRIETRSWYTNHRGPLAIHAAQAIDRDFARECGYDSDVLRPGLVLCIVNLADCIRMDRKFIRAVGADEKRFGGFAVGRYAWIFSDVDKCSKPIICQGRQGIWHLELH